MRKPLAWTVVIATTSALASAWAGCSGDSSTSGGIDGGGADDDSTDARPDRTTGDAPADTKADDATDASDAGSEASGDDGPTVGDGAPVGCPNNPCNGSQVCCAVFYDGGGDLQCMNACPDGGVPLGCTSPQNCTPQDPICCGTLAVGPGNPPNCPFQYVSASCTSACVTQIQFQCPSVEIVRLCKTGADCTGNGNYTNCCAFQQNGYSPPPFCVDNLMKNLAVQCF